MALRRSFSAAYYSFRTALEKCEGSRFPETIGDALLIFLQVFSFGELKAMTQTELDTLAVSCVCLTAELVVRFLEDYLRGDKYFKTLYPEHNLVRTRNQIALCRDMIAHLDEMDAMIHRWALGQAFPKA